MDARINSYISFSHAAAQGKAGPACGGTDLQHTGGKAARKAGAADLLQHALTQPVKQRLQAGRGSRGQPGGHRGATQAVQAAAVNVLLGCPADCLCARLPPSPLPLMACSLTFAILYRQS